MKSRATPRFWAAYRELPRDIREAAQKAYRLFRDDPNQSPVQEGPRPRTDLLGACYRRIPGRRATGEGRSHVVLDRWSCRLRSHSQEALTSTAQRSRLTGGRSSLFTCGRPVQPLVGPSSSLTLGFRRLWSDCLRRACHCARWPVRFLTLKRREDRIESIPVLGCDGRTMFSDFFHDRIPASGHDDGSISSSGVQMIGGTSPARRHASSILPRIAALARCRRFQVSRKSTPLMAAIARCAASIRACGGSAPLRTRDRTNAPALGPAVNIGMPRSASIRRAAIVASPRLASATTAAEAKRSNRSRVAHHSRVTCWCAA